MTPNAPFLRRLDAMSVSPWNLEHVDGTTRPCPVGGRSGRIRGRHQLVADPRQAI
jgi:hypothetical protein